MSDSHGISRSSLAKARHRYISLPNVFNQSAQLVPRAGGDNSRVLVSDLESPSSES
jgi:hypothetical protein